MLLPRLARQHRCTGIFNYGKYTSEGKFHLNTHYHVLYLENKMCISCKQHEYDKEDYDWMNIIKSTMDTSVPQGKVEFKRTTWRSNTYLHRCTHSYFWSGRNTHRTSVRFQPQANVSSRHFNWMINTRNRIIRLGKCQITKWIVKFIFITNISKSPLTRKEQWHNWAYIDI